MILNLHLLEINVTFAFIDDTGGKRLLKLQEASFYGIPSGYDNKLEKATISPFFLDVENCLFVE